MAQTRRRLCVCREIINPLFFIYFIDKFFPIVYNHHILFLFVMIHHRSNDP